MILVEKNQNSISFGGYSGSDGDGGWWRKTKTTNALVVQPQPCCSFSPPPEEKRVQLFGLPPPPFPPDGSFKERRNYQNQSQERILRRNSPPLFPGIWIRQGEIMNIRGKSRKSDIREI